MSDYPHPFALDGGDPPTTTLIDPPTTREGSKLGGVKDFLAQLKWPKAHEDILRARASPKFLDALQQFAPPPPGVMRQLKELANRRPPPLGVPPIELLEMLDSIVPGATGGRSGNIGSVDDVPLRSHVVMIGSAWCLNDPQSMPGTPCNTQVCSLVRAFLTPKSFSVRMCLIHPLTPVQSIEFKEKRKLVITLKCAKRLIEISDLVETMKRSFLSFYMERLVCGACASSLRIGDRLCGVCGSKKLLAMPSKYSEFAPVKMINEIKMTKLKPACAKDAAVIERRLSVRKIALPVDEATQEDETTLEGTMLGLGLDDREGLPVRNEEVERDFINFINNVPMKTLASLRVKGFRTRPLSFSASDLKSSSRVEELIHSNVLTRVRQADIKQLSPLYDLLIG
ncbi:hypothetical protein TrRE_jg2676, partial [Triparma retinervis]